MFATWCWVQCGYTCPSPTMNDDPQAFAPSTFPSQRIPSAAYRCECVSWSYRLAVTARPVPCVVVSYWAQP